MLSQSDASSTEAKAAYSWPACAANWKAVANGMPIQWTAEYPIFSDAWLTGEIKQQLGPYQLINTASPRQKHEMHLYPAVVLRVDWHLPIDALSPNFSEPDATSYHGGYPEDEVAALLGLCIGARMKAGGATRHFDPEGDPRGRPSVYAHKIVQQIPLPRVKSRVLPWTDRPHYVNEADNPTFGRFHTLTYRNASAIVKAARLHQEALWIAEGAPEMAWVLLVTAIETAAFHWRNVTMSPRDWLENRKPELCAQFVKEKREDLLQLVADQMQFGATAQFRGFLEEFCPSAPAERPKDRRHQHPWEKRALKKSFCAIYSRRSNFVHSGIPFPAMMCMSPTRDDTDRARPRYSEICLGSGFAVGGGSWKWKKKDAPMQLHIFEYIVRGALLEWWKWCLPEVPYLNTATESDLQKAPGIGKKQAERVVAHRTTHGHYKSFDDLLLIPNIGQKAVDAIKAHTTLVKK